MTGTYPYILLQFHSIDQTVEQGISLRNRSLYHNSQCLPQLTTQPKTCQTNPAASSSSLEVSTINIFLIPISNLVLRDHRSRRWFNLFHISKKPCPHLLLRPQPLRRQRSHYQDQENITGCPTHVPRMRPLKSLLRQSSSPSIPLSIQPSGRLNVQRWYHGIPSLNKRRWL
jgi:hypothetical protein